MQQYNYEKTTLNFHYPNDWSIDQDEHMLTLWDDVNGVGALQFSVFFPPDAGAVSLKDELIDFVSDGFNGEFNINEKKNCVSTDYLPNDEPNMCKYWVIRKDDMIIFGTYNVSKENIDQEDKIIDDIINAI